MCDSLLSKTVIWCYCSWILLLVNLIWSLYYCGLDGSAGGLSLMLKRWATKKTAGSTKNGRDSKPKNLGVKIFDGEVSS